MIGELWIRVDHPGDLDDAFHAIEIADLRYERSEKVDRGQSRRGIALVHRQIGAELSEHESALWLSRPMA